MKLININDHLDEYHQKILTKIITILENNKSGKFVVINLYEGELVVHYDYNKLNPYEIIGMLEQSKYMMLHPEEYAIDPIL